MTEHAAASAPAAATPAAATPAARATDASPSSAAAVATEPLAATYAYPKLPAQDTNRARRFLAEKLGIEPYHELNGHLYYAVGGVTFIVFPSSGSPSGTHDQLGFLVEDLDREVAKLRGRGVVFEEYAGTTVNGIMDRGFMKAAWFKDSEGNLLSLAQGLPIGPR